MSDNVPAPDWSQLPHNPLSFFGLNESFDRKQLKRSYSRLIRQFKPETHPAEFQQIRAAYEELDRGLRYGRSVASSEKVETPVDWTDLATANANPTAGGPQAGTTADLSAMPDKPPLFERVKNESPAELYEELEALPKKTPYDYYALGVLADLCDKTHPLRFIEWILKGIKQHPEEFPLQRLLQAYLETADSKQLPRLMKACGKMLTGDAYYFITEAAWETLLRETTLDQFIEVLKASEPQQQSIGIAGKMAFTLRMLRIAQWKTRDASPAAQAWVVESIDFLETNFEQLQGYMEYELDVLLFVRSYLEHRQAFLTEHPIRADLDRALETYFCEGVLLGDAAIQSQQVLLAKDQSLTATAFPPFETSDPTSNFYAVWNWVSEEVVSRSLTEQREEPDLNLWYPRIVSLLHKLSSDTEASVSGNWWNAVGLMLGVIDKCCYLLPAIVPFILPIYLSTLPENTLGEAVWFVVSVATILLSAVAGILGGRRLSAWFKDKFSHPVHRRMALQQYRGLWRPELFQFLDRSRISFQAFRHLLNHAHDQNIAMRDWIENHTDNDYGMAMYTLALEHEV